MNQKQLIKELAIKYNKNISEIEKAVYSQFKFVANKMPELGEIRLPFFGVFKVNEKKLQKIRERVNGKIDKEDRKREIKKGT